jgi:hypothetical protein
VVSGDPPLPARGRLIPVVVVSSAVIIGLLKLPYGMFWPDEGFYLSSCHRLLLGDLPFRDELSYASSWFFLVLTPILSLLPDGGTVLQVRGIGFAIRLISAALLFFSFRKSLPPSMGASGLAVTLLANYSSLMVPNYNSLPFDLGFLSLACWMAGLRSPTAKRALAWGGAGGILFAISCLCYFPRLPLLLIPIVVLGWAVRRDHRSLASSTAALIAAALLTFAMAAAWLIATGLFAALLEGIRFQAHSPLFASSPLARLSRVIRTELARAVPSAAVHLAFWSAALAAASGGRFGRGSARAWGGLVLLVGSYGAALTSVYRYYGDRSVPAYALVYSGLCWLPLLVYPVFRRRLSQHRPDLTIDAGLLFMIGAGQQAVAALTSTQAAAAGIPGLAASLLLLLLLWQGPPADDGGRGQARGPMRLALYGFCACLSVNSALFHFYPGQSPLRVVTLPFEKGHLEGLQSSRRFVRGWSGIVEYLKPRLQRGELLLAYENIPLLYYLTDTRPALRASYVAGFMYSTDQQRTLLDTMIREGRVPRYAVRLMAGGDDEYVRPSYSTRPEVDPLNAFVLDHYALEASVPPFEVFRHRSVP